MPFRVPFAFGNSMTENPFCGPDLCADAFDLAVRAPCCDSGRGLTSAAVLGRSGSVSEGGVGGTVPEEDGFSRLAVFEDGLGVGGEGFEWTNWVTRKV